MTNALIRLALAAAVLAPGNSIAQEAAPPPTPQEVLERLREDRITATTDATAILTQLRERRPRSDLDAFADSLVALVIAGEEDGRPSARRALSALARSSRPDEPGAAPYAGAYDALRKIFRETASEIVLADMLDVDSRRGKEIVRALLARHGDDACMADMALRVARDGDTIAEELGVELGILDSHYCFAKYHDYRYRDVLAQLREGEAEGAERAVDILTARASGNPEFILVLSDGLLEMAVSDGGASAAAGRALAVLERSARPVHADAEPYANAYLYVDLVFQATQSQAALESLVEIDPARAQALLTELAQRDQAVACKARAVLAGTVDGPRVLRDLEGRGVLTYRCGP